MTTIVDFNKVKEKQKKEQIEDEKESELYTYANKLAKHGFDLALMMAIAYFLSPHMRVMVCLTLMEFERAMEKKLLAAKEEEGWPFVV